MGIAGVRPDRGSPEEPAREPRGLPVLSEQLFRDTLIRERRRAERSDRPVGVLLVTLERPDHRAATAWRDLVIAISAARRETDAVGWFKRRHTLGIILPAGTSHFHPSNTDLFRTLEAQAAQGFSIQLCVHPVSDTSCLGIRGIDAVLAPTFWERQPRRYDAVKRMLDVTLSGLLLMLLSPVFAVVAVFVKATSRGPVLFRQERVGHLMRPFVMLKFRTMEVDAATAIHQEFVSAFINGAQPENQAGSHRVFKIVKDPRITSIGHFLRRTSIDELPQLWNVLRGDMSLVGPRPPLPYEVAQYKKWHLRRIAGAKPGVTGLWQVTGRSRTTFDEMVRLDLRYVRRRSLLTDLWILLATPRAVISGKGAC